MLVLWPLLFVPVLALMWLLDTLIKRSQGMTPSQLQRGFEVKTSNPVERDTSVGTETNKSED